MSHANHTNKSPAWSVENSDGHAVCLIPCKCCTVTTLVVELTGATVSLRIDDIDKLEELRDRISAAVEYQKNRPTPPNGEGEQATNDYHIRQWEGHAPSAVREPFLEWLDLWFLEEKTPDEDLGMCKEEMLPALSGCTDILPCHYCEMLDISHGSTYAKAVEALRAKL